MSEIDYSGYSPQEIWDPVLGQNVYLGSQSAPEYILNNWDHYQDYTGAVTHAGAAPIHQGAFVGSPPPAPPKPGLPPPPDFQRFTNAAEQQLMAEGSANANPFRQDFAAADVIATSGDQSRVLPGVRPNVGYIPGYGDINLHNFLPFDQWENTSRKKASRLYDISPTEQALTDFFTARPQVEFPLFRDVANAENPFQGFPGRGFELRGAPSDREAHLEAEIQAGRVTPQILREYEDYRRTRQQVVAPRAATQFANKIWGPLIVAGVGAIGAGALAAPVAMGGAGFGPLATGAAGAGFGAFGSGAMSRWKDPAAVGLGAAGGFLGGYGAGAAATAAFGGPAAVAASPAAKFGVGAASGFGSGVGASNARSLLNGEFDPGDALRSGGVGAFTGGAAGGTGAPPIVFSPAASIGADMILPRDNKKRNPFL